MNKSKKGILVKISQTLDTKLGSVDSNHLNYASYCSDMFGLVGYERSEPDLEIVPKYKVLAGEEYSIPASKWKDFRHAFMFSPKLVQIVDQYCNSVVFERIDSKDKQSGIEKKIKGLPLSFTIERVTYYKPVSSRKA